MDMLVKLLFPKNALAPIDVTPTGNDMLSSFVVPKNALSPIVVNWLPAAKVTDVRLELL
jgi:hypothetical protein